MCVCVYVWWLTEVEDSETRGVRRGAGLVSAPYLEGGESVLN